MNALTQDEPAAFDFSALGDLSQQATEADQQFDLHYGAAQDEYLISCIYLARIHALTAKAGRYGGGTWTKWYESKGLSEGSARTMVKNGDAFNSATVAELKQLPELTRKDLNLIARSGCAGQLVEAAGDSQRVQELLAQLKAKEYKLNETQARLKSACIQEQESRDAMNTANAQLEAAHADIKGLTEQNDQRHQYEPADYSTRKNVGRYSGSTDITNSKKCRKYIHSDSGTLVRFDFISHFTREYFQTICDEFVCCCNSQTGKYGTCFCSAFFSGYQYFCTGFSFRIRKLSMLLYD